jgi:sensor histidine kinase YesM
VHGGWKMLVANILLLPALPLGFGAATAVAAVMGWQMRFHSFDDYRQGLLNGLIISSIFFLYRIWKDTIKQKQDYELQLKSLENETLKAKLAALNYQMNPHLLFNSLNTIASMIPKRPEAAEDMTVQLSELYRGILVSVRGSSHSLGKELDMVRAYLNIENARFGDRVRFQIQVAPDINPEDVEIPVLLIQPLVENAIKHGLSEKAEGGNVKIQIQRKNAQLRIIVEDDGIGFGNSNNRKGSGTGLENCKMRLRMTYGDAAGIQTSSGSPGTRCEIFLPHQLTPALGLS